MQVIRTIPEMHRLGTEFLRQNRRLGLVPTMGYLHEAHLGLIDLLNDRCDVKAASIFVNPIQFTPGEDFKRYPRDEVSDLKLLEERGCELVFAPDAKEMYPDGFQSYVQVTELEQPLCGIYRPGHFRGVATIVLRLFTITRCAVAAFGLKDYQQAKVIERMNNDLNLNVELLFGETVREPDGLALSSRNVYLSESERKLAARIPTALETARRMAISGAQNCKALCDAIRQVIGTDEAIEVQYIEAVDPESLKPRALVGNSVLIAVAAYVGRTRLIDNIVVGPGVSTKPIPGIPVL